MARFSRLFLGGIVGAGLALLLAPKTGRELRSLLMGRMRPALPPAEEYPSAPEAMPAADLQARIEETRRQVEAQLARTAPPEPVTVVEPESVTAAAEAPVEAEAAPEAPVEEAAPEAAAEVAEAAVEETTAAVEEAAVEEEVEAEAEAAEAQAPPEEEAVEEQEAPVEEAESVAEEAVVEAEAPVEEAAPGQAGEFPALKTPATGEPTVEEAPAEAPEEAAPGAGPAVPEPSRFDQDEMRRRIDETRARLKAKAFDAMVSGETFIETEGEGKPGEEKKAEDFGLEDEVGRQIDEELREEP